MALDDASMDPIALVKQLSLAGRDAQRTLAAMESRDRARALEAAAAALHEAEGAILAANAEDVGAATSAGSTPAMIDQGANESGRLLIDTRIRGPASRARPKM